MMKDAKLKILVIGFFFFILSVVLVHDDYQQKKQSVLQETNTIEFYFKKVPKNDLMIPDLETRIYSDAALLNIPLLVSNPGGKSIQLEDVVIDISIEDRSIAKREINYLMITPTPKDLLLEDVEVRTETLDEIITGMKFPDPENPGLVLEIDIYIHYPYKIRNREISRPELKLARVSGEFSLLSLMGGKSMEEAAEEFVS